MTEVELAIVRRAYAKQVTMRYNAAHPRVEAAFAAVRREAFLGPGPWPLLRSHPYVTTPDDDPVYLYQDILVGIIPERRLNNGQPSGHAMLIARADPRPGEHAVHIGAGVGYYTAIIAHMVGSVGWVTAIEYDPDLAARLAANFAGQSNVRAVQGDGTRIDFDPADVIYVNAGATRPVDHWLDRLKDGGRMILALTKDKDAGGAWFRIERRDDEFLAKWIFAADLFPCEGGRDAESERALVAALEKGGGDRVTRLFRHGDVPEDQCWLKGPDWCLAYD
ncbi:MAG TPA: rRNA adenine N-6-methyltransferase family protein [Xanthobacteraceae bacterium]|jgi:protein-L-isoaspartate(D-aspartate) O-methyltransferase|nr:rRNA adenine N-6-methyltransferase family protein [Xanthobacteraceae bacterium]